eukprot:147447-Rhodomonas_salina.1
MEAELLFLDAVVLFTEAESPFMAAIRRLFVLRHSRDVGWQRTPLAGLAVPAALQDRAIYGGRCAIYGGQCAIYGGQCAIYGGRNAVFRGRSAVYVDNADAGGGG